MATTIKNRQLFCLNCGGSYQLHFPILIPELTAKTEAFDLLHKDCPQTYVEPVVDQSKAVRDKAMWWMANGFVGMSSRTMWNCLMGNKDFPVNHPYDPDDFSRCWKLLEAVPEWKGQLDKLRTLSPVWDRLVENWPKLTEFYEDMRIHKKDNGMYDFMQTLIR